MEDNDVYQENINRNNIILKKYFLNETKVQ